MKTMDEIEGIIQQCEFLGYRWVVEMEASGNIRLYGSYTDVDISTGREAMQHTRKWLVSKHATKSEIVQTVFKLCMTSMEHRTREGFKYKGKRVFGPHFDVDALWALCECKQFDYREPFERMACPTCGGANVDPSGLHVCRDLRPG